MSLIEYVERGFALFERHVLSQEGILAHMRGSDVPTGTPQAPPATEANPTKPKRTRATATASTPPATSAPADASPASAPAASAVAQAQAPAVSTLMAGQIAETDPQVKNILTQTTNAVLDVASGKPSEGLGRDPALAILGKRFIPGSKTPVTKCSQLPADELQAVLSEANTLLEAAKAKAASAASNASLI